jgi:membrane protein implicated in regulation of membrane protease activity
VSFVEQRRNVAMAAYRGRAVGYLSRCEALQEGADKSDCLAVLRAAVTEANAVVADQRSGVLQSVPRSVGLGGMALYGVLILAAGLSIVLALRAEQVRVHLVLLAACLFVLACFRFVLSCTTAFRVTPPSIYAWPVLDTIHSIAMTAALAVLALFWGRAVHEELHPNRALLLGTRVALVAGSGVVAAYGFIMCFVAPNFLVADASGLLFTGFQLVVSVLLVAYAALIVRTVLGVSGDDDDKRRSVAPNPAAARNSMILLGLASLICLFLVVVMTVAAFREAEYLFRVEGELWFQVLRLTAEFLIVSALLAIVILSVWSPQRRAKKPSDHASDTQLSEPLVPRQYSDY